MESWSSYSPLICPVCIDCFDDQNRVPIVGKCGHTVCLSCVDNLVNSTCPICQKNGSFHLRSKNYMCIELLAFVKMKDSEKKKTSCEDVCCDCKEPFGSEKKFICVKCIDEGGASVERLLKKAWNSRICLKCSEAINRHGGHSLQDFALYEGKLVGKLFLEELTDVVELSNVNAGLFKTKSTEIQKTTDSLNEVVSRMNAHFALRNDMSALVFDLLSKKLKKYGEEMKKASDKGTSVVEEMNTITKNMVDFLKDVSEGNTASA